MQSQPKQPDRAADAPGVNQAGWLERPIRLSLSREHLACAAVALGVFLRVWEYLELRPLYMDEGSLLKNLVGRAPFDFTQVLVDDQMAPPAFLVIERVLVRLPLDVRAAGRLFPLLCGIASLFLMRRVAARYLDARAVPMVVAFFALGDHLIYYSAEIKQYSCDLLMALAALQLAAPPPPAALGRTRFAALAAFGLAAPWFSFPVVFLLAGVGLHLIARAVSLKDWRGAARAALVCSGWGLSFIACFLLSRSILSQRDFIWVWWNFAFLPLPPRSVEDLTLLAETLANVFINPAGLLGPFELLYTASLASVLAFIGCVSLGRRWAGGLFLLLAPPLFALAASGLRQYPFHGRLLFCLVPTYLMLLGEGIAAAGRRTHWPVAIMLVLSGFFLYGQAVEISWQKTILARARKFDSHGDLKNDLLDELEYQRARAAHQAEQFRLQRERLHRGSQ